MKDKNLPPLPTGWPTDNRSRVTEHRLNGATINTILTHPERPARILSGGKWKELVEA